MRAEQRMTRDGAKRVRGLGVQRRPTRGRGLLGGLAAAALACALLWLAPAALADEFTVTKLDDDGTPGTLRDAVEGANGTSGDDTITITATGTIELESALPPLAGGVGTLAINGPGADRLTVRRSPPSPFIFFRILEIEPGAEVTIDGLTVANGSVIGSGANGGGIENSGTLTLLRSTVRGNHVTPTGGTTGSGGGIYNFSGGTLVVDRSTISGNTATSSDGFGSGGGIGNVGDELTVSRSTISGSTADLGGGGIETGAGTTLLASVTLANNEGGNPTLGHNLSLGIINAVTLQNTIAVRPQGSGVNCDTSSGGTLTSAGFNLADDASCELTEDSDRPGVDPNLGPLADNGGPTETHSIAVRSAVVDQGLADQFGGTDQRGLPRPSVFPDVPNASGGDGSDIGAFERQAPSPPPNGEPPSNEFSFGKARKNKKRGTAKLTVNVPGPGALDLAKTKKVKGKDKRAAAAGEVKLPIKPKPKAKHKLNKNGKAKVVANVTYTPTGGQANTKSTRMKLVKRR